MRREEVRKVTKLTPELISLVEEKLTEKWSPEQISGWLPKVHLILLSHERIYQHLWADKATGGELFMSLRRHGKKYHKRSNGKTNRGQIRNRITIDERPVEVDAKSRVGDWEIDTVIDREHSGALVTLVERVTQFTLFTQVESKSAEAVAEATIALLKPYAAVLHAITVDNGKELVYHEKITKELGAQVYFAHATTPGNVVRARI